MPYRLLPPIAYGENAASIRADAHTEALQPGREKLLCRWTNTADTPAHCQLELRVQADFAFTQYLIPGVSYNGNAWGRGKEPKGLALDGQPWVFDYRRTTIPACTISENKEEFLALFASDCDAVSLTASCAMEPQTDGTMRHRLLYPEIERPVTYCTRDGYADAHEGFITLQPGETITTTAYVLTGRPAAENFAAANVQDAALELLGSDFPPRYTPEEVSALACSFAQRLLMDVNGRKLFSIGQLPNEQGVFENRRGHEFGWCGQNGMYARLFIQRGVETGDDALTAVGTQVLDAYAHEAVGKTGLIHTHYHWMLPDCPVPADRADIEDTCNQGFAIAELSQAWQYLHERGTEHPAWLTAARGAADFLIDHYMPEHGFGKAWNVETGECADPQGTIGAYVIPGLVSLYHATEDEKYLDVARTALRFYRDRDLRIFRCTAGALDTYCIDKESSGPLLAGALALYDIDGSDEWLDCAKKAGWYFCSWMFHHDTLNRPGSHFAQYGYRTLGGTSVSAQHHHIDPWGALVVPQMLRLWEITGDTCWKKRADLLWASAIQNIAPQEGTVIHGQYRGPGAQNEGYHHCHWGEDGAPGYINVWLVAWPQAFCWNAAVKMRGHDGIQAAETGGNV